MHGSSSNKYLRDLLPTTTATPSTHHTPTTTTATTTTTTTTTLLLLRLVAEHALRKWTRTTCAKEMAWRLTMLNQRNLKGHTSPDITSLRKSSGEKAGCCGKWKVFFGICGLQELHRAFEVEHSPNFSDQTLACGVRFQ